MGRPNLLQRIAKNTAISVEASSSGTEPVTLCVFLMQNDYRTGNWDGKLPNLGFVKTSTAFTFSNLPMDSYCKDFPEAPTPSPPPPDTFYDFPASTTDYLLHGMCVMGATHAMASGDDPDLFYTPMADFMDGVKLWDDANYITKNVLGDAACEGGIYLRPNLLQRIAKNTVISVEASSSGTEPVTLCVFLMTNDYRHGNWDAYLPTAGFTKTISAFHFNNLG